MDLVLSNVGQPNPIVVDVFGERYEVGGFTPTWERQLMIGIRYLQLISK